MICTATVKGIPIEVRGTPEQCAAFFRAMYPAPAIEYGRNSALFKKVCDPLARHSGNCGAEDCPILEYETKQQVSLDGQTWCDVADLWNSAPCDFPYSRIVRK